MSRKIAIVGSGISAGLAAHLLADQGEITWFQSPQPFSSGIAEIVRRRPFFAALASFNEAETVNEAAPDCHQILWHHHAYGTRRRQLASTEKCFVYDKGRLAALLTRHASVARCVTQEVPHIAGLTGFDRVFDCRGARAVLDDPSYRSRLLQGARTACRYLVLSQAAGDAGSECRFWSERAANGSRRTFFSIPLPGNRLSLGCSCLPGELISADQLRVAMAARGIVVRSEAVLVSGCAQPGQRQMFCDLDNVTPLGDARQLPCPLNQYGTLNALSHIREAAGNGLLPALLTARPNHGDIDPHLPQELFYE